jgi:hypothetical protein
VVLTVAIQRPARVCDVELYWSEPSICKSARCLMWERRIRDGWRPGKRIRVMGYYSKAQFFGVYIWEYLNVISPLLDACSPPPPLS